MYELQLQGVQAERQKIQPINYKGLDIDEGYRIDILAQGAIMLELKALDTLNNVHVAQLLTYLKLSGCSLGYLINFNVKTLKDGLRRIVNQLPDQTLLS